MRRFVLVGCLSMFPMTVAQAQIVIPAQLGEGPTPAAAPAVPAPWSKGQFAPVGDSAPEAAGLPMGLRVQVPFRSTHDGDFVAGAFDRLYGVSPPPGAGLRYRQAVFEGGGGRLCIAPGVDAHPQYSIFSGTGSFSPSMGAGSIATDVDLIWQGTAGGRGDSLFGVKMGGGAVGGSGPGFAPTLSFFGGLRF
jgi:hypothetical protein